MFIHTKDTTIKLTKITAITKITIPATMHTPECYAVCVYLESLTQPIVIAHDTVEERDELFEEFRSTLDVNNNK